MPATVIAERIGWERGITILRDRVAELRPLFVPPDPCSARLSRRVSSRSGICGSRRSTIPVGFGQRGESAGDRGRVAGYSRWLAGG